MNKRELAHYSFMKSIPILCSYLFVSMAYGILMEESGFPWYDSLLVSLTVYTGAFQFVLTSLLSAGAPVITIGLTACFMNSRQTFYSLTFVDAFDRMGKKKPYMIHTMTDETYAVNCVLDLPEKERQTVMFYVAVLARCYWMIGAVIGGVLGQLIPVSMDGIDFCMTALFVTIFVSQWENAQCHFPAVVGLLTGLVCLMVFGESSFILPALLIASASLVVWNMRRQEESRDCLFYFSGICVCSHHLSSQSAAVSSLSRRQKNAGMARTSGIRSPFSHYGSADCLLSARGQR